MCNRVFDDPCVVKVGVNVDVTYFNGHFVSNSVISVFILPSLVTDPPPSPLSLIKVKFGIVDEDENGDGDDRNVQSQSISLHEVNECELFV